MNTIATKVAADSGDDQAVALGLFALTFNTGLVDAVSFIALGHVFTANMTGNIVFLAFAFAGVPGLSIVRSAISLAAFMCGAVVGGILNQKLSSGRRLRWTNAALVIEAVLLLLAAAFSYVVRATIDAIPIQSAYLLIALTALAMGVRNAVVRKLALPDLTTTVLTLTATGLASDSFFAGGTNPRWVTRSSAILTMFAGALAGALMLRAGVPAPLFLSAMVPLGVIAFLTVKARDIVR